MGFIDLKVSSQNAYSNKQLRPLPINLEAATLNEGLYDRGDSDVSIAVLAALGVLEANLSFEPHCR